MNIGVRARRSMVGVAAGIACSYGIACAPEPAPTPTFEQLCGQWCQRRQECADLEPSASSCTDEVCPLVPEECRDAWTETALCLDEAEAGADACQDLGFGGVDFGEPCTELVAEYRECRYPAPADD